MGIPRDREIVSRASTRSWTLLSRQREQRSGGS